MKYSVQTEKPQNHVTAENIIVDKNSLQNASITYGQRKVNEVRVEIKYMVGGNEWLKQTVRIVI